MHCGHIYVATNGVAFFCGPDFKYRKQSLKAGICNRCETELMMKLCEYKALDQMILQTVVLFYFR